MTADNSEGGRLVSRKEKSRHLKREVMTSVLNTKKRVIAHGACHCYPCVIALVGMSDCLR